MTTFPWNTVRSLRRLLVATGVIATSVVAGCGRTNILSTRDEVHIGRQAAADIDRSYRVDTTSSDAERVRRIGERLLQHADSRKGVPYSFKVIDLPEINAVSLPGGPIYVFRGLLDLVGDDDDALASVMGHELGHINARHAAKQISDQLLANIGIMVLVRGQTTANLVGMGLDVFRNLPFSRGDEYDADRRGLSYAYKAGFDPRGMVRFFDKLKETERKGGGGSPEFLRTHPVTTHRIERAQKLIEEQDYRFGQ